MSGDTGNMVVETLGCGERVLGQDAGRSWHKCGGRYGLWGELGWELRLLG